LLRFGHQTAADSSSGVYATTPFFMREDRMKKITNEKQVLVKEVASPVRLVVMFNTNPEKKIVDGVVKKKGSHISEVHLMLSTPIDGKPKITILSDTPEYDASFEAAEKKIISAVDALMQLTYPAATAEDIAVTTVEETTADKEGSAT